MTAPAYAPGPLTLTVSRAALVTADRYGNETRDWSHAVHHTIGGCAVQPIFSAETSSDPAHRRRSGADREFSATHLQLLAPAGTDLLASDRVGYGTAIFEVDGPPMAWADLAGVPHHVEAVIKLLEG